MASARNATVDSLTGTDSGIRRLTNMLRERNATDDTSPFVSRAGSRLDLVRPRIEEAKTFIASTRRRIDLDERTMGAELASAELAVSLFSSLVTMYEKASKGSESVPLKLISVAANTLGAYLKKGSVLQPNIYSGSDTQVMEAQISQRRLTAMELHNSVSAALDGVEKQLGVDLPPAPL
jgi:hypothetical protein